MANLKELRNRIASVSSTMQITSAMKMVSAAKLKKAQDAITMMRPYAEKLQEILVNVSATLDASEGVYSQERPVKKVLVVAVSSNRGLCGAFNANVMKQTRRVIAEHEAAGAEVQVLTIGKKINDVFRKETGRVWANRSNLYDNLSFTGVEAVAQEVMDAYASGAVDQVVVIYNRFKNAATQIVTTEAYLPVSKVEGSASSTDYIYEPGKVEILGDLIPKSLKTQLYKAVLDSNASEHGARMTAMHKATDNANELRRNLTLDYNKARQAAITNEILEIVGGAEALNG